jgi:hypothetical protein
MEKNEQQMRGTAAKLKQEAMRFHSERRACPRRELPSAKPVVGYEARRPRKSAKWSGTRDLLDADLLLGRCSRIAYQALCPREPTMRPLCS